MKGFDALKAAGRQFRKSRRLRMWWLAALLLAVAVGIAAAVSFLTAGTGDLGSGPAEVIVVFGSPVGLEGELTQAQQWRVQEAVEEYRRGVAPFLLFAGGAAANRFVEADVMAAEAVRLRVPAGAILRERHSRTTVENISNVALVLKEHGWQRVEMISSPDHLPRIAILLHHPPYRWRLHAAPTPGRNWFLRMISYSEEALATLVFRIFGQSAEPVLHGIFKMVGAAEFAVRWVFYRLREALS